MVLYVKWNRHRATERLHDIRQMLATVPWEDLAPCKGCHMPCVKALSQRCDHCGAFVACKRECDPWALEQCIKCRQVVCQPCAALLFPGAQHGPYCYACLPSPPSSSQPSSDLSVEPE